MKKSFLFAALLLGAMTISAQEYTHSVGAVVGNFYGVSYKGFIFGVDGLAFQVDLGVKLSDWGKNYTEIYSFEETMMGETEKHSETIKHPTEIEDRLGAKSMNYFTFEVNPNIVYNLPIHSGSYGTLAFCAGGGVSLGLLKAGTSDPEAYRDENGNKKSFWWAISQTYEDPKSGDKKPMIANQLKFGINALVGLEMSLAAAPIVLGFDFRPGYGMGYDHTSNEVLKESSITNFFDWTLAASIRYRF